MIKIKSPQEIEIMREGGLILAKILNDLKRSIRPGMTTNDIEKLANELISFYSVKPAFLNYNGYPASLCISINEEAVHCLPSDRKINNGDLVSIDAGIIFNNFYLDSAITAVALGGTDYKIWAKLNPEKDNLLKATRKAMEDGISKAKPGNSVGDISEAIEKTIKAAGLSAIKELTGHGVGRNLHEEPRIYNFNTGDKGVEIKEGMVFAVEPIVGLDGWRLKNNGDGYGLATKDNSWVAHFEHSIAVTKDKPLILTTL